MAKTYKELKGSANKIKIEEVPLANTADRLGTHLEDVVDTVDEDITQIKKDYTLKSQMLVISETNPTVPPTLNGQFHYNKLENRMFVAASGNASPLTQIEGRSLLGAAPTSWKIRYNQDSGKVSHFEQIEHNSLLKASFEQIVDDNELEVEYTEEIPQDREGYDKTLFYGVDPNDAEATKDCSLYATYAVAGWIEVANADYVKNNAEKRNCHFFSVKKENAPLFTETEAVFPEKLSFFIPGVGFYKTLERKIISFPNANVPTLVTFNWITKTFNAYTEPTIAYSAKDEYVVASVRADMCDISTPMFFLHGKTHYTNIVEGVTNMATRPVSVLGATELNCIKAEGLKLTIPKSLIIGVHGIGLKPSVSQELELFQNGTSSLYYNFDDNKFEIYNSTDISKYNTETLFLAATIRASNTAIEMSIDSVHYSVNGFIFGNRDVSEIFDEGLSDVILTKSLINNTLNAITFLQIDMPIAKYKYSLQRLNLSDPNAFFVMYVYDLRGNRIHGADLRLPLEAFKEIDGLNRSYSGEILGGTIYLNLNPIKLVVDYASTDKLFVAERRYLINHSNNQQSTINKNLVSSNLRICAMGSSSVDGGIGMFELHSADTFYWMQEDYATTFLPKDVRIIGNSEIIKRLTMYRGEGVKISGVGASIEFYTEGDELSFAQFIPNNNANAALIDVFVDGVLIDTFNNKNNKPIGSDSINITANETDYKYDLGRCYTYNHTVTVGGVSKTGRLVKNDVQDSEDLANGVIDYLIVRRADGTSLGKINHFIVFGTKPVEGIVIKVDFDYSQEISYVDQTANYVDGSYESSHGDYYTRPITENTVWLRTIEFRRTNDEAVRMYRFKSKAKRNIRIVVKGPYGNMGNPSFTFNMATNRLFWFQNAGKTGFQDKEFLDRNSSPGSVWDIMDFKPDYVSNLCLLNGMEPGVERLNTSYKNLTDTQVLDIQKADLFKSIAGITNDRTVTREVGVISEIDKNGVSFLVDDVHTVSSPIEVGDVILVGTFGSNRKEIFIRAVESFDSKKNRIEFDVPVTSSEYLYDNISDFVGKEIAIRKIPTYTPSYSDTVIDIIKYIRKSNYKCIYDTVDRPDLQNNGLFNSWGYNYVHDRIGAESNTGVLRTEKPFVDWQYSQVKDQSININASELLVDPFGNKYYQFGVANEYRLNYAIEINGIDVYGRDAYVLAGRRYIFNPILSGVTIDNSKATLYFENGSAPSSGIITVRWSSDVWSRDATHYGTASATSKLYGDLVTDRIKSLLL